MKKSILIVDDEFGLADVVSEMLAERGYDVTIAINGRLGLDRLENAAQLGQVDLVLLDVMMPVMTGPQMLAAMRANPALKDVPVIMMTAVPEAMPKSDGVNYQGALRKPFAPDALFQAIAKLIGS